MENKIKNIVLLMWAGGLARGRTAEKVGQMTVLSGYVGYLEENGIVCTSIFLLQ